MASSVATPLIKQFETIEGIDTISATSQLGSTQITIQFNLSRDIDAAAADVQAAISRAVAAVAQQHDQHTKLSQGEPGRRRRSC